MFITKGRCMDDKACNTIIKYFEVLNSFLKKTWHQNIRVSVGSKLANNQALHIAFPYIHLNE